MPILRENDILFFNLHRCYLAQQVQYGGFLGIFLLAAFINNNGYAAQSYAGGLEAGKRLLDEACQQKKAKMIGLYCDYENVTENIFLSRYIKERYQLPVIVGGPQATALKMPFFAQSLCDAVVRYEGELTVLALMNFFLEDVGKLSEIEGISYLTARCIVTTHDRNLIKNLDALPFIDEECFLETQRKHDVLNLMTGRGCPFHCAFCHEGHHTRKVRFRSVENVLSEIDLFLEDCPAEKIPYILFTMTPSH